MSHYTITSTENDKTYIKTISNIEARRLEQALVKTELGYNNRDVCHTLYQWFENPDYFEIPQKSMEVSIEIYNWILNELN